MGADQAAAATPAVALRVAGQRGVGLRGGRALVPGVEITDVGGAFVVAAVIAVVNAVLPPLVAALRLPFTLLLGFLSVLLHRRRCAW